ncbi:probable phytol kinase 3, chloroplastic [Tanacetum coccineum]
MNLPPIRYNGVLNVLPQHIEGIVAMTCHRAMMKHQIEEKDQRELDHHTPHKLCDKARRNYGSFYSRCKYGKSASHRELIKGPVYYAITLTLCGAIYWRTSPIAIVAICNLCAGDGNGFFLKWEISNFTMYYSMYEIVRKLAHEIQKGVAFFEGVEAKLWQVDWCQDRR